MHKVHLYQYKVTFTDLFIPQASLLFICAVSSSDHLASHQLCLDAETLLGRMPVTSRLSVLVLKRKKVTLIDTPSFICLNLLTYYILHKTYMWRIRFTSLLCIFPPCRHFTDHRTRQVCSLGQVLNLCVFLLTGSLARTCPV